MSDTPNLNHQVRHLTWKLKAIGKQLGKASATIYALRNENAALREAVTFNPGDRARLYAGVRELSVSIRKLSKENAQLREKVKHLQEPHVHALIDDALEDGVRGDQVSTELFTITKAELAESSNWNGGPR